MSVSYRGSVPICFTDTTDSTLVGQGTHFPFGFNLGDLCRLYWQNKWDSFDVESDISISDSNATGWSFPSPLDSISNPAVTSGDLSHGFPVETGTSPTVMVCPHTMSMVYGSSTYYGSIIVDHYDADGYQTGRSISTGGLSGSFDINLTDYGYNYSGNSSPYVDFIYWQAGVEARLILTPYADGGIPAGYQIGSGASCMYYPRMEVTLQGYVYDLQTSNDSGYSLLQASTLYTDADVAAAIAAAATAPPGLSSNNIQFSLLDTTSTPLINNFNILGWNGNAIISEGVYAGNVGGGTASSATSLTITLTNTWSY